MVTNNVFNEEKSKDMESKEILPNNLPDDMEISWHALDSEEVLQKLGTPIQSGLTSEEAARRLEKYGPNQLTEKPRASFFQTL